LHVKANTNRKKVGSKRQKIQSPNCKSTPLVCKSVNLKGNKKAASKVRQVVSRNNKKTPSIVPLRRSTRKAKSLYLRSQIIAGRKKGTQGKKNVGRKKGKQSKSKKVTSQRPKETTGQPKKFPVATSHKKRIQPSNSYWLNGLQFSRKPNDDRVMLFKEKKHIISDVLTGSFDCPKCRLCRGDGSTSNYIACEICGGNYFSSLMLVFLTFVLGSGRGKEKLFYVTSNSILNISTLLVICCISIRCAVFFLL
jgi:hypothetical protein